MYIHVPFCATTCDFCAFYQTLPKGEAIHAYLETVAREADLVPWAERRAETAFWGGGTPGLLRPEAMEKLGRTMLAAAGQPREWSVELAPATVTPDRVAVLKSLGVTRVSLGVQSFRAELLNALGRQHKPAQIYRAYGLLRDAGFASVNLDLMFALPNQTQEQWRADLDEVLQLAPDHLSTYCLTFEENTALWVKLSQGKVKLDVNTEAALYNDTWNYLETASFGHYEISNFARSGHICYHNLNTWRMHEWVGLGPSAASQSAGWRGSNPPDLAQWWNDVSAGRRAMRDREPLTPELLATDSVVFGLRMDEGISLPELQQRFPTPHWVKLLEFLPQLIEGDLATLGSDGRLRLTRQGQLVADSVGREIMAAFADETVSS